MSLHQKTVNYAKALFNVEGTKEQIHTRQENLELLAKLIQEHPKLLHLLSCPELGEEEKLTIVEETLKITLDPYVKRLAALILKRRKVAQLRLIALEYHKLVVDSLKEIDVEVTSADPLTDESKDVLKKKLVERLQKKVNLIEIIDPSLLGGFTLLIHHQLLDLSIKGKLTHLKRQFLKAHYVA